MAGKDHNTSDEIIDLIDIVQSSKEDDNVIAAVDFDSQLSGLLNNNNIMSDDNLGLDGVFGAGKEKSLEGSKLSSNDRFNVDTSGTGDLDGLLDSLFEEDKKSNQSEAEGITGQKELFLEKALEDIDDIDTLLNEAESSTSLKADVEDKVIDSKEIDGLDRNIGTSDLEEIEAILDSAMPPNVKPVNSEVQIVNELKEQAPTINEITAEKTKDLGKIEGEIQELRKQIIALELVVMGHEAEVEELQEKNLERLALLENQIGESLSIEKITEKVFSQLQGDIDKVAAEAAARIIREEIVALKNK